MFSLSLKVHLNVVFNVRCAFYLVKVIQRLYLVTFTQNFNYIMHAGILLSNSATACFWRPLLMDESYLHMLS